MEKNTTKPQQHEVWRHKKTGLSVVILGLITTAGGLTYAVEVKPINVSAKGRDKTPRNRFKNLTKFLSEYEKVNRNAAQDH